MDKIQERRGITLIALIITIVVLLILAGISIGALTGNNNILGMAKNAKTNSEIEEEKEIVKLSGAKAKGNNKYGNITENQLQIELDKKVGKDKTITSVEDKKFVVEFIETKRCYELDRDGNIEAYVKYTDSTPGKLAGTGTEDNPFLIECIEDLVALKIMVGGGNSGLGLANTRFSGKVIKLGRTLDFNSKFSYNDYTTTIYGDINGDGVVEEIKTELTKRDTGCLGFGGIGEGNKPFQGTFDGDNFWIKNLYVHRSGNCSGFFRDAGGIIKNLTITGDVINDTWHAGGINGNTTRSPSIINCTNYANVTGKNMVGGITNRTGGTVEKCKNYGKIKSLGYSYDYGAAGGMIGYTDSGANVIDCINYGEILGGRSSGIIGCSLTSNVINCINCGKANGGMYYRTYGSAKINIINCINTGKCGGGLIYSYQGSSYSGNLVVNIYNSYNLGETTAGAIVNVGNVCESMKLNINNFYNAGTSNKAIIQSNANKAEINIENTYYDSNLSTVIGAVTTGITSMTTEEIKSQSFVNTLNSNIGENTEWKEWELGKDEFPVLKDLNY